MAHLEAAIFDMDGLMIDSEPVQLLAMNAALAPLGVSITEEEWVGMVGKRGIENLTGLKERYGFEPEAAEVLAAKNIEYHKLLPTHVKAMPGLHEAIQVCKDAGLRLAVASSSPFIDILPVLDNLGLRQAFEVIASGEEVVNGKPDPEIFLSAAQRLGVDPSRCLVFEDTGYGVAAAKAAGMFCIAVPNYFTARHDFTCADKILASLLDFTPQVLAALGE